MWLRPKMLGKDLARRWVGRTRPHLGEGRRSRVLLEVPDGAEAVAYWRLLTDKGYDVNYTWSIGNHGMKQGGGLLPDMLRWLWRDQLVSIDPRNMEERSFAEPAAKTAAGSRP